MIELGRRAISAGWVWMPGALGQSGDRVSSVWRSRLTIAAPDLRPFMAERIVSGVPPENMGVPDFSDAATAGCLFDQCAQKHTSFSVVWRTGENWPRRGWNARWYSGDSLKNIYGVSSRVEALVAALEAEL